MPQRKAADLLVMVDKDSKEALYTQIYQEIRSAILEGKVAVGERLPSIVTLSRDLGVSHTTVEKAYLQLSIEGYVANIPKSGYRVNALDTEFLQYATMRKAEDIKDALDKRDKATFLDEHVKSTEIRYDFSYANLQPGSFPLRAWKRIENELVYTGDDSGYTKYSYVNESSPLRDELAKYLAKVRGVRCIPEQIILQPGTDSALTTILSLFNRARDVIGIEEPGYPTVHEASRRLGFKYVGIESDTGSEAYLSNVHASSPNILFSTPSHQFPTGRVLQLDARIELLKWARDANGYIIEDDSCCEYRYDCQPVPSLQSLDAWDRVIYMGNFSKVLAPGLRLAFFVLPPSLIERYYQMFKSTPSYIPWMTEQTLAGFMEKGFWDQHVRRMLNDNRKRHDELLRCLEDAMGDIVDVSGQNAGMHLYVTVNNGMTQDELIRSARDNDVAVYGTKRFWFTKPAPENNVLIGFSHIAFDDIEPGIDALARAWHRGGTPPSL